MNPAADKLKAEIATAESRIAELEKRPGLTAAVRHQIEKAKNAVRDLRINLAAMQDHREVRCPNCQDLMPHSFFVCRPCMREVPFPLYIRLKGAEGFHHHGLIPDSRLAEIKKIILSHLRQHGTALPL